MGGQSVIYRGSNMMSGEGVWYEERETGLTKGVFELSSYPGFNLSPTIYPN